jgi:hypothetical protein
MGRAQHLVFALAMSGLLGASANCHAVKLISEKEARLPDAPPEMVVRGITRGPGIELASPNPQSETTKSPFGFKVAFQPRGGAKIDAKSVQVTYVKDPAVDLSERLKGSISEGGIDLKGAEAPPGVHHIRVSVADSEGRKASAVFVLKVIK